MKKFYLVCKVEYEYNDETYYRSDSDAVYNDETYYRPDSDAVNPKFVFTTPEAANQRCLELNLQWIDGLVVDKSNRYDRGFSDYAYDAEDLFSGGSPPGDLAEKYFPNFDRLNGWDENNKFMEDLPAVIMKMTPEDQMQMIEAMRVVGWEVREVAEG